MSNSNISQYLVKKSLEIAAATESMVEVTQDWQQILEFMKNRIDDVKLTKKQREKMKRYSFAFHQASSGKFTDNEVRNLLCSEFSISKSQAFEDMRCMREIYISVENPNKRFELMIALQVNKRMMIKCEEMGEMLIWAMLEKNRIKLIDQLQVEEENPAADFKGQIIQPQFAPSMISDEVIDWKEITKMINEKRYAPLALSKLITEIPYEDLDDKDSLQQAPAP